MRKVITHSFNSQEISLCVLNTDVKKKSNTTHKKNLNIVFGQFYMYTY